MTSHSKGCLEQGLRYHLNKTKQNYILNRSDKTKENDFELLGKANIQEEDGRLGLVSVVLRRFLGCCLWAESLELSH